MPAGWPQPTRAPSRRPAGKTSAPAVRRRTPWTLASQRRRCAQASTAVKPAASTASSGSERKRGSTPTLAPPAAWASRRVCSGPRPRRRTASAAASTQSCPEAASRTASGRTCGSTGSGPGSAAEAAEDGPLDRRRVREHAAMLFVQVGRRHEAIAVRVGLRQAPQRGREPLTAEEIVPWSLTGTRNERFQAGEERLLVDAGGVVRPFAARQRQHVAVGVDRDRVHLALLGGAALGGGHAAPPLADRGRRLHPGEVRLGGALERRP